MDAIFHVNFFLFFLSRQFRPTLGASLDGDLLYCLVFFYLVGRPLHHSPRVDQPGNQLCRKPFIRWSINISPSCCRRTTRAKTNPCRCWFDKKSRIRPDKSKANVYIQINQEMKWKRFHSFFLSFFFKGRRNDQSLTRIQIPSPLLSLSLSLSSYSVRVDVIERDLSRCWSNQ